jgi:hypothetical protein
LRPPTDSYDPQTGRVTEQNTQTGTAKTSVDDLNYRYDEVGNVLSEADTPSGNSAAPDAQCFQYDYLGRMTQAWARALPPAPPPRRRPPRAVPPRTGSPTATPPPAT